MEKIDTDYKRRKPWRDSVTLTNVLIYLTQLSSEGYIWISSTSLYLLWSEVTVLWSQKVFINIFSFEAFTEF